MDFLNRLPRTYVERPHLRELFGLIKASGMRCGVDGKPTAIAAVTDDQLLNYIFDPLAIIADDAYQHDAFADAVLHKIDEWLGIPLRGVAD